jgi:hypothetical protein
MISHEVPGILKLITFKAGKLSNPCKIMASVPHLLIGHSTVSGFHSTFQVNIGNKAISGIKSSNRIQQVNPVGM